MKNKISKNRSGVTLVEIIIALAAAFIVALSTSIVLISGQRSLDRGWLQANLQRDASFAMLKIKNSIASATKAELEEDENSSSLKIYNSSGWIKYKFVPELKEIRWQLEDQPDRIILSGTVESLSFEIDPVNNNAVNIELELKNGESETQTSSTIMMRNYGS